MAESVPARAANVPLEAAPGRDSTEPVRALNVRLPNGFEPEFYWTFENSERFVVASYDSGAALLQVFAVDPLRELSRLRLEEVLLPGATMDVRADGTLVYLTRSSSHVQVRRLFGSAPVPARGTDVGSIGDFEAVHLQWVGHEVLKFGEAGAVFLGAEGGRVLWDQPVADVLYTGSVLHLLSIGDTETMLRTVSLGELQPSDTRHDGRVFMIGMRNGQLLMQREGRFLDGPSDSERFTFDTWDGPRLFYPDLDEPYTLEWLVVAGHVVQVEWRDEALRFTRREDLDPRP